jgi:signal transduction histidine kinase/CheY-like chemotaxis protein/HPt (histidine-containing phosphotransfer) domain-containing protein
MNQTTPSMDYLSQDITERSREQRDAMRTGGPAPAKARKSGMTRTVARRLIPACIVTPALLWWILIFGVHRNLYALETCFILFVYSVTVVFGVIVCLNLRKLAKMDAEQVKSQEQLRQSKEAAEAANRFKSAFFANISHEIRTPLTAINGFAELLMSDGRSEEERRSDARVIRRNGEHLLTLINDILDQSKIEAGKMSVEPILCCPAAIVGEVCSMLTPRAAEKGLSLSVKFEGSIPKKIRTDPTRLRQVLINLVANAIKFTKEGGVVLTTSIKPAITAANPMLEVKITDTGIGISAEQQALLFKPFMQADASISRHYGGSGLGLAISKHFAQALGGDISVSSEAGKGSTFTVAITTGSLIGVEIHDRPEEATQPQEDFSGPKVRITGSVLVAEDGIDNQALIAAKLRETGLKVEVAENGKLACEKALSNSASFDLILMDVQMPEMDGYAATLHLRSKGYRGPIIALTANAGERDRSKCLNAGCNDFVTKPINMEKLIKAIGRHLTMVRVAKPVPRAEGAATGAEALAQKFYQELPAEVEQIEQAVEREDRVQLKEAAQLLLGKSSTAGLKDVAAKAARLLHAAENEQSWEALRETAQEFIRECQPDTTRQAA